MEAVREGATLRAEAMLRHAREWPAGLLDVVGAAAVFHDLGKLDARTQAAVRKGRGARLEVDHVDAGVAHLLASGNERAAWLVRAHHSPGLPCAGDEAAFPVPLRGVRDRKAQAHEHEVLSTRVNECLADYLDEHERACGVHPVSECAAKGAHGLAMRLALSCLVDADHTDTAAYDAGEPTPKPGAGEDRARTRWAERLAQLDRFVAEKADLTERSAHRAAFYAACRGSAVMEPLARCEGPVGIGKTTAVTANLLQHAIRKDLRHIFIIAPYTNIITQAVRELRKALVLPGERPEEVIAEHHHRADFSSPGDRDLATLWRAPIIVTTAVQFFETLAGNTPARLRKLHELPGSAVFLDESHAALPATLWPQNWRWTRELMERWGCRFVFASGSLARFWTLPRVTGERVEVPDLAEHGPGAHGLHSRLLAAEYERVRYERIGGALTLDSLREKVRDARGPRLVILNTVQTAAVVAQAMRDGGDCGRVLHLSTALCPRDRDRILWRVMKWLKILGEGRQAGASLQELDRMGDWTLVATSCVEAGVDLSFRSAFRETAGAASTIQVGGRVNRHGEWGDGTVYDFEFSPEQEGLTQNPGLRAAAEVLRQMLERGEVNGRNPAEVVTEAMDRELRRQVKLVEALSAAEARHDYPTVAKAGKVIDDDTVLVVVDDRLRHALEARRRVDSRTLLRLSVQLRRDRVTKLGLKEIPGRRDVYAWRGRYDPDFLGYMADAVFAVTAVGCLCCRRSPRGAWLKRALRVRLAGGHGAASRAGAWVETPGRFRLTSCPRCRSPRGGVG